MLILLPVLCIICYGFEFGIAGQQVELERQRADAAQKQVELLLAKLRSLGISQE